MKAGWKTTKWRIEWVGSMNLTNGLESCGFGSCGYYQRNWFIGVLSD
jgi:hypothetical protein